MIRIRLESGRTFSVGSLAAAEEFARQAQENYTVTMPERTWYTGLGTRYCNICLYTASLSRREELIVVTAIKDFPKRLRFL